MSNRKIQFKTKLNKMNESNNNHETANGTKSVLGDVFSLFLGEDKSRPAMHKPFEINGKVYATDTYTLVRTDKANVDFVLENKHTPPNCEGVIPEINTSEIIDIDAVDWTALMNKDETIGDGNDVECGHCNGDGTCYDNFLYESKFYDFEYECPVCNGSGYEREERQIPTGNKTFGSNDMVRFKEIYFYATKFYKLKKVKDLVGGNIELISYNKNNRGVLFRIGCLDVLIMPCMCSSEDCVVAVIA